VNPFRTVEIPGAEPLAAWRGLLGGAISVTRRGAEVLRLERAVVERSLVRLRETRDLFVEEGGDRTLLLALALLLVRPMGS
jgi:hypothetical protein